MLIASYIARYGTWIDRAIAAHDGGRFSHSELVFSNGDWFSSSWRDGGTRFKRIDPDSGHWELVNVPATLEFEQTIRAWCEGELGVPYDMSGVLAYKFFWRKQDPNRWYCSEIVSASLRAARLLAQNFEPHRTSPNGLYELALWNWGGR
jgi:hypothetical protein